MVLGFDLLKSYGFVILIFLLSVSCVSSTTEKSEKENRDSYVDELINSIPVGPIDYSRYTHQMPEVNLVVEKESAEAGAED